MTITITGAAGFLGQRMARALAKRGERLTLADLMPFPDPPPGATVVSGSLADTLDQVITTETTAVVNLAAVVSSGAEANFSLGYEVNLIGLQAQLERCRLLGTVPRFLYTSSLAVFGPVHKVNDTTATMPQSSYGTQKALGELLVNDYSRKGYIDGRSLRVPTVSIRPGAPNAAASGFASGILREPLAGKPHVCPVSEDQSLFVASPTSVTRSLLHALELPPEAFTTHSMGTWRSLNIPGITVTVKEMVDALRQAGGDTGLISFERDPAIEKLVASWPAHFDTPRALSLGFEPADDLDTSVQTYIEETKKMGSI